MSTPSLSELRQLSNIISNAVDKIEETYKKASAQIPSIDVPFNPTDPTEALAMTPEVMDNSALAIAAAAQLTAILRNPGFSLVNGALMFHISTCLRIASAFNIVEILRDGPKSGEEIGKICNTDGEKLARVLRLLAAHHIFKEVSPDVFANNRLSSVMDKGKPVDELLKSPVDKFAGTSGISAIIEHTTDECMKSSAYLAENLLDPKTAFIQDPTGAPLLRAFNTKETAFTWLELPENAARLHRFGVGQTGIGQVDPPDAMLIGFKFKELPAGSVVVDVGGGLGSKSIPIAEACPELSIVVQDRPAVVEQGKTYWAEKLPNAKVDFQAHSFFDPQPVKKPAAFLLRCIIHDWPDVEAIKILKHLRDVAGENTKLIVIEQIAPYVCESDHANAIPNAAKPPAPKPLLPNLGGAANGAVYWSDLQMMSLLNARERTIGAFSALFEKAGWKLSEVFEIRGSLYSQIVASPA